MKSELEAGQSSKRDENSLYTLTKKFIQIIKDSPDNFINMSKAAEMLCVAKRRIYDITNVLEGLGLVSKWSVNSVKWVGNNINELLSSGGLDTSGADGLNPRGIRDDTLDREIEALSDEISEMSRDPKRLENAYVTYEDLQRLSIFREKLLFAIKAPSDTTMEYPRYCKGTYRMRIMTENGKISVYYVNNDK